MTLLLLLLALPLKAQEVKTADSLEQVVDTLREQMPALTWQERVGQDLSRLLEQDLLRRSQVAVMVYDLTTDSVVFAHNERQTLRPASTQKLVTAITAIDRLGGSYRLKTDLYYRGRVADRVLTGDVYSVGGFDPMFNGDDMKAFSQSVRRLGVDTIRGSLRADVTMKDDKLYGEGWCWDDNNPVLTPLLVSKKDQFMERFAKSLAEAGVVLDDSLAAQAVGDDASRDNVSAALAVPDDASHLCTRFHTIDQVLMRMMKESDNLYAEALFYQIAWAAGARPATAKGARNAINRLITKVGLRPADYKIADGSGLSLYNYVSAELEVALLRYAFNNRDVYLHLYPSLPIAGVDGTLKKRMSGTHAAGNVHAKTGSVTGVFSLAGYCTATNGHSLAFCIINQGVLNSQQARTFQDRVCEVLCQP